LHQFTDTDAQTLLFGTSTLSGIVSAEPAGANQMHLYQRQPDGSTNLITEDAPPWLLTQAGSRLASRRGVTVTHLEGDLPLSELITFNSRNDYRDATSGLSNDDYSVLAIRSPITQFLVRSGITLFKDMQFEQLRRLQLDIETLGLDPTIPEAEVIMVALRQDDHEEVLIQETNEAEHLPLRPAVPH
jgi:hypothetical protein